MAKWQDTYEELKKKKKITDNIINENSNINYDIAPISTKTEKKWYQNIINLDNVKKIADTEHLKDGYDFGDITKTILGTKKNLKQAVNSTVLDVDTGLLKGVSDIGVSAAKLISGGVAQVADWVGEDEYADKVRKRIAGQDEETNKKFENKHPSGLLKKLNEKSDEKSILGETADEITGGVGYYGGMFALQGVGVPWQVTAGVTSAGNELGNAYANGAEDWEAWLSSGISAGVEIGSEYIFGGVKLPGTGQAIEPLLGKVTDKISKNGIKYLTQAGIQMGGEGLEEVISGIGSAIGQKLTYMNDKELKELYTSEDALKDFVIGAAVSGITMGANPNTYQNIKDGRSLITGRTSEEATTIENLTKEAQTNAEKLKGSKLTTQEKKIIENVINGEVQSKINELKETLENTQDEDKKTKIQKQITELQQQIDNVYSLINNENQSQNQEKNTESNENVTENNAENNVIIDTTNKSLNNIANQIQALESQLDTSQNASQQQELLNQIQTLEQKYNEILQQEQNVGLPIQEVQPKELQINEDIGPIQEVIQKEINKPTTQETKTNSSMENESNTPKDVKSSSNIEVGKNNKNVVNKEVNNEVNQTEERKVINNEVAENLQEQSTNDYKSKQLEAINESNPADDSYHTWVRSTENIKTFDEAFFEDGEYSGMDPDFTESMAKESKKTGKITVYSSYPIENGVFVSPSQIEASQYAGGNASKLYSKEVNINDVAWIDGAEGQYAKVEDTQTTTNGQEKQIQGLESYSKKQIKDITRDYIQEKLEENNLYDVEINDLEIIGSRNRGTAKENSDLDIVVEYTGDIREDDLFNILNEEPMYIDGVQVDINPINEYDSGTLKEFMERSNKYDKDVLSKLNENATPTQQELDNLEDIRLNKSGSEYASAFYDLEKKYGIENLSKSLSEYKTIDKIINNKEVVKQVSRQVEDAIAPIQETVKELKQTLETVKQVADTNENIEPLNESKTVNLENQIDNALSNSESKSKSYLGKVTNSVAAKIKSLLGIEVKNRKHVLSDNDIRHMMKQHSNQEIESRRGQIAITKEDIKNIPDIINHPDDITKGTDNKLGQTIRYIKRYNDNTTNVVEVVPDNSNALIIKTMWKKPSTLTNSIAPSSTSETKGSDISSTLTGNISQKMENVNDIAPIKKTYKADEKKYDDTSTLKIKSDKSKSENTLIKNTETSENENIYSTDPTKEISYELNDSSEKKRVAEILTEEPKKIKKDQRLWATMKANLFDKGAVFEDLSIKTKNRDLMGKWDYSLTSEARAQNVIGNGHTEYDVSSKSIKQTSKSLNDIVAEVENTGLKKEFYDYMYHKHNIDRMNLESKAKEKIIDLNNMLKETTNDADKKAIEKEIKSLEETVNKPVFGDSVTSEVSKGIVEQYENENPRFMDFAQDVYDYVNADRQQLVKEGIISQETADLWSEMYPHYVPIRRVDTNGNAINVPLDTGRTGINAPIKKATGGSSDILPLFDTMAMRTLQTYKAIAKNSFGVELKNTLNTTIENQQTNVDEVLDSVDQQESLLQEGKNGKKPTFTVFENGEKVTYEITQDMYDALKPLSESSLLSKTFKPFNTASNFHRGLLTEYNPVFMITNAVKDIQDVLINSQHTAKTYSKIPEAYTQILSKGYWYQEYVANGGEQNSYFDSQENTFKTENKGIKKILDAPPFSTISKLNNIIEMAPRLSEYIASREQGRSVEVSMLDAARVTTNFKAGGNITKWANRNGATFLNASVQGAMQQVRNVREANMNGLRGWANLAAKFAMAGLPAILLNGLIWKDDDDYEELSDYVKQNYYIVWKKDDGTFIRIPKGRTVAVIQEAIQQVENARTGDDEVDLKSFLDLVLNNLAPNNPIDNNIISPITQVISNKTWYGEDLVPTRLQDVPANEQYDESTDTFSRWLGDKLNISPMKINYVLNQYSGGVGDVVLPMITPKATNDADSVGDYLIAPFVDKFTTNAIINNKNPGNLFETSEKLTTNAKSSKATDNDVLKNKFINSIKNEMNELYKQKREIQSSDLSKGEKYEQVLEIQSRINELSKYGLNNYEDVDISGNYATVGNRQYKLNSDEEWEKITDKQIEKQEKVSNSLNISASKYWSNKEEYDYAYENPGKYAVATAITDYKTYKIYSKNIYELKSDKDEDGNSISGSRKAKVISYVNGLDLSIPQKAMLIRQTYSSFDDYNDEIVNYVSNLNIDYDTKKTILEALDMKVYADGSVGW
jgi:predicted nucleotidyltransferase